MVSAAVSTSAPASQSPSDDGRFVEHAERVHLFPPSALLSITIQSSVWVPQPTISGSIVVLPPIADGTAR